MLQKKAFKRLGMALALSSLVLPLCVAHAGTWPEKPIRLIIPAGQGGSADPLGRMVGEELSKAFNQSVVVENRPGANGNIGANAVVKADPDGYTLLFGWTGTLVPVVTMYNSEPYHPQRDLAPIGLVASVPNVIVVQPDLGITTFDGLADYAKKNPGTLNFGSTGSGSSYHLSGELFNKVMDVSMVHVPYTSPGAVFTDLLGGRLQLALPGITAAAPMVKDGRLNAVAVMSGTRSEVMPDVPTTTELGQPELKSETWFGVLAPAGTPPDVIEKINGALNAALQTSEFRARLVQMGFTTMGGTPQEFVDTLAEDIEKWGEIVKFSGAQRD